MALLRKNVPNAHLLMLNALYPVPESAEEANASRAAIQALRLEDSVSLVTDFLDEPELLARLACADVIVYPYQQTQESASAAVKLGLSSLAPIAVTPLPIFADIATVTHRLPGMTPAAIATGLSEFFARPDRAEHRAELRHKQEAWVAAHAWPHLSARLDGLIRGELTTKFDLPSADPFPVPEVLSAAAK